MQSDGLARAERALERACSEATSVVELLRGVHAAIAPVVPVDRWCGFAVDPATLFATNGYHDEGVDGDVLPRLLELEYGSVDALQLPSLARLQGGVATLSDVTGGDPASSGRWRDVLVPSGLKHEMRALFSDGRSAWGALILFRGSDLPDFSPADARFIRRVAPRVADGFRSVLVHQHLDHAEDVREAGILLLGGDPLEVRMATNAARTWLDALDDGAPGGGLPTAVLTAALLARRTPTAPSAVRARTRGGRWITLTAEVTNGSDDADVGVIVQPSRPAEVARVVGSAHGLTRRESDIVLLVAAGRTNQEIARALGVSPYTVADHLKSVFAKLAVATRGELTSKLFFDHYLPQVSAGLGTGVDSWFLPG